MKQRIAKRKTYFLIKFPNGAEALVKVDGWKGCDAYTNYIKDEFDENTYLVAITRWEAFKFFLKGRLFTC